MFMITETGQTESLCAVARLLSAMLERPVEEINRKLGIPYQGKICLHCSKPLRHTKNTHFCSYICQRAYTQIELICDWCGKSFKRRATLVVKNLSKDGYQHIFCSRKCMGNYAGNHYGFAVHPENARAGGDHRKWDWIKVLALKEENGWGGIRISRALGIPLGTVSRILRKGKIPKSL